VVNNTKISCDNVNTLSPARNYTRTPEPYASINSTLYYSRYLAIAATERERGFATGSRDQWHTKI
jgi:hypothetical protein